MPRLPCPGQAGAQIGWIQDTVLHQSVEYPENPPYFEAAGLSLHPPSAVPGEQCCANLGCQSEDRSVGEADAELFRYLLDGSQSQR